MRDCMHPPRMSAPSCIVPPTEQLVIRPHIVPLLPIFHGMESENPYSHIKEFEEVCNTFQEGGASIDLMRLKLKRMRYMEAINACPYHGFDTWLLVSYFYDVSRGWDEPNVREVGRMKSQPNAKGGMYVLNEDIEMKADVAAMAKRLEELEMKKVMGDFVGDQKSIDAQLNKRIDSVEMQEKGKFPSQPHQNPKGIHEVKAQEGESSNVREVKAVITLRSGKEVDQPTSKPKHDEESVTEKEKSEKMKGKRKWKSIEKDDYDSNVDEEPERIVIKEDMCKSPVKYKDPGCPTISVSIGGTCVEKALLDLEANRSVKIPRGMIEDVLVQVDKFYHPVDFVVLDTDLVVKGTNYVPIILGRPFLATPNAIINYRNEVM
ncbi:hypothetical protein CK203_112310 [Vitis vinifera]|uniref:Uncharacterized protein n=1 Tax=Vitis vinifera TaxID=29760 RepID=A0A438C537_VITVI|nr:hypothetical protein CK203_112310 [Vitis vinifera]